jgi:excisionase family DNA binding protein
LDTAAKKYIIEKMINWKKKFFSTGEVGKLFGVSRIAVYKWIKNGKLQAVRVPDGKYRIAKKELLQFSRKAGMPSGSIEDFLLDEINILIADDDVNIVETLSKYLKKEHPNFNITSAKDGFEAGNAIARIKPEVVIMDIFMPGINGFKVCRAIKQDPATKDVKVIVVTGYASEENVKKAKESGAEAVFSKPFDYKEIETEINTLLR